MTQKNEQKRFFYTVDELYQLMTGTVSKATIYYLIKQGRIPSKRFGEKPLIPAAWVDDFLYTPASGGGVHGETAESFGDIHTR